MEIVFAIIIFGVFFGAVVAYVKTIFKRHREDKALEALFQLRETGSEEAVESLFHALKSEFASVRKCSASMLREMPEGRALEPLISVTLKDKEFSIQNAEDRKEKKIEIVLRAIALVIGLTLVLILIFELTGIKLNIPFSPSWYFYLCIISGLIALYLSNHLELSRTVIWGFLGFLMPFLVLPVLAFKRSEVAPKGGFVMETSTEELQAQIVALGQQSLMGIKVNKDQVNQILRMCNSEEDKKVLRELCAAFGLQYSK